MDKKLSIDKTSKWSSTVVATVAIVAHTSNH